MTDWIWRIDLALRKMRLDPHSEPLYETWGFENIKKADTQDSILLGAREDRQVSFAGVKNAEKIILINKNKISNIWYRVNGVYENLPLSDVAILSNNPAWGKLDRLYLKSTNQSDEAEINVIIYGSKEQYNGIGNP